MDGNSTVRSSIIRRHDIDALRGITMLIGIAAHAALSFSDIPWFVKDCNEHSGYGLFFLATRGFRMPLFFLLSGFFTAMVLRRRGLSYLLRHRALRILVPLFLACLTILPAIDIAVQWADATAATRALGAEESGVNIWSAAATGDLEALQSHIAAGVPLDSQETVSGQSALAWAVIGDQPPAASLLLASGADPNARFRGENTALHTAALLGRGECAELLLQAGADVNAENASGTGPMMMLRTSRRLTEGIAETIPIEIDYQAVIAGRKRIATMLVARGVPAIDLKLDRPDPRFSLTREIRSLIRTPFFHHLWFLWFLCWLVVGFAVIVRLPLPAFPRSLICSGARWLWIIPLTMIPQAAMQKAGSMGGFGPDLSVGLLPNPQVLFYYAIFFGFGALYYDTNDEDGQLTRTWWAQLPLALLVVLPLGLAFVLQADWTHNLLPYSLQRTFAAFLVVSYAWLMIFGLMGLFRRFLSKERPWLRYLSDSTYWLYLVHLPLMIVGQALIRDWPIPSLLKFILVLGTVTGFLLIVYRYAVRYTVIGRLLNGPRRRPGESR